MQLKSTTDESYVLIKAIEPCGTRLHDSPRCPRREIVAAGLVPGPAHAQLPTHGRGIAVGMRRIIHTLIALLLVAAVAAPAGAQDLSAQDRADIRRVEQYLNSITTMRARFIQVHSTEGLAQGNFYLSRPGRMRIDYDPPLPYVYVADGFWLTFYDSELGQRSDVRLGSTLADFITRRNVRLSGEVTVTGVRRPPGELAIDLVQTDDPGAGTLTLIFQDDPLALVRWRVVDAQGLTTEITLTDREFDVALDRSLFSVPRRAQQ